MEIIDEDDEEVKRLMLRISRKEITLCDSCEAFFDYVPQKVFCDECMKAKNRERQRERQQRPEYKAKKREYDQRPEVKERRRKQQRERYHRKKKLREEE